MTTQPDREAIRQRAYQIWERRGRPGGSPEQDWYEAERELLAEEQESDDSASSVSQAVDESVRESFPASDPPATHGADEPPVNADAKWAAAEAAERNANEESAPARTTSKRSRKSGKSTRR